MFKRAYVEITNVCNLHCSFCHGTVRPRRTMSVSEFAVIAGKLRPYTEYLYFHVLGEPLLHPRLSELLAEAHARGFRVCLTTNGVLLPQQTETLLSAPALHKVSVSLHSFEGSARQGALTDYLDGVWAFADRAASQGILVSLRLWNGGGAETRNAEIEAFLSQKLGCGVSTLPADRTGGRKLREQLYLERAEQFDWPDVNAPERETEYCHGLSQQIAVLCDGTVVPCCLDGEGAAALGNILEEDLEDILRSPRAEAIRQGFRCRHPAEELCRRCGYATRFNRKGAAR